MLEAAGLKVEGERDPYVVEGRFLFYTRNGFWRTIAAGHMSYGARSLIAKNRELADKPAA